MHVYSLLQVIYEVAMLMAEEEESEVTEKDDMLPLPSSNKKQSRSFGGSGPAELKIDSDFEKEMDDQMLHSGIEDEL